MGRIDIVVDLETLGVEVDAPVMQVSAVRFDISNGDIINEFDMNIDISEYNNMNVNGNTLKWWLHTDKELLHKIINNKNVYHPRFVWKNFEFWISKFKEYGNVYLWGNGIMFDNAKVKYNMEKYDIKYPIEYTNDRDVRTILDLACDKTGMTAKEIKLEFTDENEVKHNAIDDCKFEARYIAGCYRTLYK